VATKDYQWGNKVGQTISPMEITKLIHHRYCHTITRAQQQDLPDESGGGILADEMGMGKSLTTLVLVEMTLNNAHQWAEEQKARSENFLEKKRCRATLVVVPSQGESRVSIVKPISGAESP
jgi:SNF2 family DNA or RNA helicase